MRAWQIDWFSTAAMFPGWAEYAPYEQEPFLWRGPETYDPLVVYQPRTWLLREGWRKGGAAISTREVPSTIDDAADPHDGSRPSQPRSKFTPPIAASPTR
jgi:hypothetical protein